MHSRSAACVFGEARLISSTSRTLANTGPGRNSNSLVFWLKTFTPVTSDGSRSGVNWIREKEQSGEGLRQHRLPNAGKVLDDQVPLRREAEDDEAQRLRWRADDEGEVLVDLADRVRGREGARGLCADCGLVHYAVAPMRTATSSRI